jgi:uncharacterized delta-60 repeat protein
VDGKYIVGGSFTTYSNINYNHIIKLNNNGTIDTSFVIGTGFNNSTTAIKIQSDGKIVVTGYFTEYSGSNYNRLIRLNTDGTIDTSFVVGSGFSTPASNPNEIKEQVDGKLLIAGTFSSYSGLTYNNIIRLSSNGLIDTSFVVGTGFNSSVLDFDIQSDGKIIVTGFFTEYSGSNYNRIIRLNTDGSIDTSFVIGTGFNNTPTAIKIQSDGKIVVTGRFTEYSGFNYNRLIRLNTDGSIDTSFVIGSGIVTSSDIALTIQPDNKIIVGGGFSEYSGVTVNGVVRLNVDGSIDSTFNMTTIPYIYELYNIAMLPSGQFILGGFLESIYSDHIYKINNDGSNNVCTILKTPTPTPSNTKTPTPTPTNINLCDFDLEFITPTPTPTPTQTPI